MDIGVVIYTDKLDQSNALYDAFSNFCSIYESEVDQITLFGPNKIDLPPKMDSINTVATHRIGGSGILRPLTYILYQFQLAIDIYRHKNSIDVVFFHNGGTLLFIPMIILKTLSIPRAVFITGSPADNYRAKRNGIRAGLEANGLELLEFLCFSLSNIVIKLSEDDRYDVSNQKSKVANLNYIDTEKFKKKKKVDERQYDFIFVGRFESEKGINEFVQSVPTIAEAYSDIQVQLLGDGSLLTQVENIISANDLSSQVKTRGWVDHNQLSSYLNNSKYIVIPSHSEGLPKVLLEAMSCGVVPIVTPVGGMHHVITEGETGFVIDSNEPHHVADKLISIYQADGHPRMSDNATEFVQSKFSYPVTKRQYLEILDEVYEK